MPAPSNYNEVKDRLREFFAKHPEGSLRQVSVHHYEIAGMSYLAYTAAAYRTPDDVAPAHGTAWEVVPGATNFTRGSELQNAETSAWGRAIIACGAADAQKGVATAEDVEWRQAEAAQRAEEDKAIPGLRTSIEGAIARLDDEGKSALKVWMQEQNLPPVRRMGARECDVMLDHLMTLAPADPGTGSPEDTGGEK